MAEDPKTRSLLLAVMDGHGEDGDKVTQNMKGKFASYLFKHPEFEKGIQGIKAALTDVIARMETEVIRGKQNFDIFSEVRARYFLHYLLLSTL